MSIKTTAVYAESWNVAWRKKPTGTILTDMQTPFHVIKNAYRYWAADPFVVEKNGETYIFAELYDYVLRRGILGCCKLDEVAAPKWIPIIKEDYHLSYPFVLEQDGKMLLMPESSEGKNLVFYEAEEFPYKWKKSTLLRSDVQYADTTPIIGPNYNLALTHQVDDPYYPQLLLIDLDNRMPDVNIDIKNPFVTRPAGSAFVNREMSIRPAQKSLNCDEGYGKGLLFYRYFLDENLHYSEELLKEITPSDLRYSQPIFLDGMHTYNSSEHYEVIDIKTRRFNLLNFIFRIVGKLLR